MFDSKPLVFYDISSPLQPPRSYAPNPTKARYALNFKQVPFETSWVDILDIPTVREGLACAATRTFADGSDYYTLPMLREVATGRVIGDSFQIANYLEETYPQSESCLFPQDSTHTGLDYESPQKDTVFYVPITTNAGAKNEAYAKFQVHVDTTFTSHIGLVGEYMPFNPDTKEATENMMAKRAGLQSWDQVRLHGEARDKVMSSFKESLTSLSDYFRVHKEGPFLEGLTANYADLIVGGWLNMLAICMPPEEWAEFRTWHDGIFAQLHDALQEKYITTE